MTNREAAREWGEAHGYGTLMNGMRWMGYHVYMDLPTFYGERGSEGMPPLVLARHGMARDASAEEAQAILAEHEKHPPLIVDDRVYETLDRSIPEYAEALSALERKMDRKRKRRERKRKDRPF